MTPATYHSNRLARWLFPVLITADALIYWLRDGRITDTLVVAIAAVVAEIPQVRRSHKGVPLTAIAGCLGLIALQWPRPELWALNLAVSTHLLSLWSSPAKPLNRWAGHALIVSSLIVFWYCLGNHGGGWKTPILAVLGALAMVVCWIMVQARDTRPAPTYALLAILITPVTGALMVGMVAGEPVLHVAHYTLGQGTDRDDSNGRDPRRSPSGTGDRQGLDLAYSPNESSSEVMAYLAVRNPPSHPQQFSPPFYLRDAGFSAFTGKGWVHSTKARTVISDLDDGNSDRWTQPGSPIHDASTEFRVYLPAVYSTRLPVLPGTHSVDVGQVAVEEDGGIHVTSRRAGYISYRGKASIYHHGDLSETGIQLAEVDLRYFQMPTSETISRLEATTMEVIGEASSPAEKIRRIADYMRSSHTYLLQTDRERATLTNFLYGEKKGHCTLFATSTALMLRMAGIPSRVSVGYCGSRYDPKGKVFVFDRTTAHAWAEYKTKDHGWIILDTTPTRDRPVGLAGNSDFSANLSRYSDLERERVTDAATVPTAFSPLANRQRNLTILALFAIVAVFYLLILRQSTRTAKTAASLSFEPTHRPLTDFFSRFCQAFAQKGAPRQRYQTAREYVNRLKQLGHVADEWDDMLAYYYAVCYEGMPPSEDQETTFLKRLDALEPKAG